MDGDSRTFASVSGNEWVSTASAKKKTAMVLRD